MSSDMRNAEWIAHIIVSTTNTEIVIEGQWQGLDPESHQSYPEDVSGVPSMEMQLDQEKVDQSMHEIERQIQICLRDAFGSRPIRRLKHVPSDVGLYQIHNNNCDLGEAFEYRLIALLAQDWPRINALSNCQRAWRKWVHQKRLKSDVFTAWFERCLRPNGATGERIVRTLAMSSTFA
jgi:hypothetical protein